MKFAVFALCAALAGCAQVSTRPPIQVTTEAPRCTAGADCDRLWIQAQQATETITGMRLRTVTDTRIETFAPTGFGKTGAVVSKWPLSSSEVEVRVVFECYGQTDCSRVRPAAINAFNNFLARPGASR